MERSLALAVFAVFCAVPMMTYAAVTKRYDRFKDRTEVTSSKSVVSSKQSAFNLLWMFHYAGRRMRGKPDAVILGVVIANKSWEYLRCHDLIILVDGKRVPTEESTHRGDVQQGIAVETVVTTLSSAVFRRLAKASKVEMQICRTEYTLDGDEMRAAQALDDELNEVPLPQ